MINVIGQPLRTTVILLLKGVFAFRMISFKIIIGSLFGLVVIAIAVLGIFFYQDSQDRVIAAGQVSHGHQVIRKTEEISSAFKNVQLQATQLADLNDTTLATNYCIATKTLHSKIA